MKQTTKAVIEPRYILSTHTLNGKVNAYRVWDNLRQQPATPWTSKTEANKRLVVLTAV